MTFRVWSILVGTLVALMAASVFYIQQPAPDVDGMAIQAEGIGPLVLGREYQAAVEAARRIAPDSALAGPGCGGLDEIRFSGRFAGSPASVMGMAQDGILTEIELGLDSPLEAADEADCLAMRDRFGEDFVARFGPIGDRWEVEKPVSREHLVRTGPVVMVARWFSSGRSCYVSVHYRLNELP